MEEFHSEESVESFSQDNKEEEADNRKKQLKEHYETVLTEAFENSSSSSNESLRQECPELYNEYRASVMKRVECLEGGMTQVRLDMFRDQQRDNHSSVTIKELDDESPLPQAGLDRCRIEVGVDWVDRDVPSNIPSRYEAVGAEHMSNNTLSISEEIDRCMANNTLSVVDEEICEKSSRYEEMGAGHEPDNTSCMSEELERRTASNTSSINEENGQLLPSNVRSEYEEMGAGHEPDNTLSISEEMERCIANDTLSADEEICENMSSRYEGMGAGNEPDNTSSVSEETERCMANDTSSIDEENCEHFPSNIPAVGLYEELGEQMPNNTPSIDEEMGERLSSNSPSVNGELKKHRPTSLLKEELSGYIPNNTTFINMEMAWQLHLLNNASPITGELGEHVPDYTSSVNEDNEETSDYIPSINKKVGGYVSNYTTYRNEEMGGDYNLQVNEDLCGHMADFTSVINEEFRPREFDRSVGRGAFTVKGSRGVKEHSSKSSEDLCPRATNSARTPIPKISFLSFEQELSRCEDALKQAKTELREERKKQVVVDTFRMNLLEVDRLCSEELVRVRKDGEKLEPLNQIAAEWERDARQAFWYKQYHQEQQRTGAGTDYLKSYVRRTSQSETCEVGEACQQPTT